MTFVVGGDIDMMSSHCGDDGNHLSGYGHNRVQCDAGDWVSAASLRLCLNVVALLLLITLVRRTGRPGFGVLKDAAVVIAVVGLRNRHSLHVFIRGQISRSICDEGMRLDAMGAVIGTAALAVLCYAWGVINLSSDPTNSSEVVRDIGPEPRVFPCRTTHTRLFPESHSFSYSYLYAGIPIGWTGAMNTLLSAETSSCSGENANANANADFCQTWFSVEGGDHLERTSRRLTLLQKLHGYLDSQGVMIRKYPYVYLVTAPRFLGFSFNPVSFWYLYSEQKQLTAMILEVNNTFDERRMYFLERKHLQGEQAGKGQDAFVHSWPKDFHVSPFNERDGNYTLKANDPFAPDLLGRGLIDNTITLSSPDGSPKLVARVFSDEPPILASTVNKLQALQFIFKWWWVGFMTNVRILREARKLWMKNLRVFYRPEVLKTSIGRQAAAEEDLLAEKFLTFLRFMQRHSTGISSIRYTAAAGKTRGSSVIIPACVARSNEDTKAAPVVDLHVLTPAFYSNLFQWSDVAVSVNKLCLNTAETERLAVLSDPEMFLKQITALTHVKAESLPPALLRDCNILEAARRCQLWRTLALLTLPVSSDPQSFRSSQASLLDLAIFSTSPLAIGQNQQYTRAVIAVLLAERLANGSLGLLHFYKNLLRFLLLWLIAARTQVLVLVLNSNLKT